MARYGVIVTRDTTESTFVEIEADSEDEAEWKARTFSYENPNLEWEQDCTPNASKDHYTNGADLLDD